MSASASSLYGRPAVGLTIAIVMAAYLFGVGQPAVWAELRAPQRAQTGLIVPGDRMEGQRFSYDRPTLTPRLAAPRPMVSYSASSPAPPPGYVRMSAPGSMDRQRVEGDERPRVGMKGAAVVYPRDRH